MKINTNMAAQQILSNLNKTDNKSISIMQRLSSGLRINKAADDAAGLAIANKMATQVRGLKQANRNAMDGISMIQTAEGAMNEIHSMLQRVRELTVQAANGTYTDEDKEAINSEINELMEEITTIQKNTQYNKISLLNGSRTEVPLQVGANSNQSLIIDGVGMDINQVLVGINGITADRIEGATPAIPAEPVVKSENKAEGLKPGDGVNTLGPGTISADALKASGDYIIADGTTIVGDVEITGNIKLGNNVTIRGNLTVKDGDLCAGTGLTLAATNNIVVEKGNLKVEEIPVAAQITVNGSVEIGAPAATMRPLTVSNLSGNIENLTVKDHVLVELKAGTNISGDITVQNYGKIVAEENLTVTGKLNVFEGGWVVAKKDLTVKGELNISDAKEISVEGALIVEGNLTASCNKGPGYGDIKVKNDITVTGDVSTSGIVNVTATTGKLDIQGDLNSESTGTITAETDINIGGDAILAGAMTTKNGNVTITGTVNSIANINAANGQINVLDTPKPQPPVVTPPVVDPADETKEIVINGERKEFTAEEIANGIELPAHSVIGLTLTEEKTIVVDGKEITIPAGEQVVIQIGETDTQLKDGNIIFSADDTVRFPGVEELEKLNKSTLDLSHTAGTDKALESIDQAITKTSVMRSRLGAYQNRLEHTVSNLGTTQENMTSSLSRIQDADMAEEMTNYTQASVLTQAGTAMLAQANQRPQQVLQLLNN